MRNDDGLQKELCDVPPVPENAFSNIEHQLYHNNPKRKIIVSLVASLLLIVAGGLTIVTIDNQNSDQTALSDEVVEELELARSFINGDESYQDSDALALIVNGAGN